MSSGAAKRHEPEFDESADMRLVELQRIELGVPARERGAWESHTAIEGAAVEAAPTPSLQSAVVTVELTATPGEDVIPGAVITLSMSIANEGSVPARNVRAIVPLAGGASYRNGSFVRDGRPLLDDAAEEFFERGAAIESLAPKTRVTFLWKIGVRIGNKPLVIAPTVTADESAVVGGQPLVVSRRTETQTGFAAEVQRFDRALYDKPAAEELPIYELDDEEIIEHEAAQAALSEYQPPLEPPPQPEQEPGVPEPEPYIPEPPSQPPDVEPAAEAQPAPVREAVVLYGRLDRPSVAYFERIFNGTKPPTLLNHFILGGALACTQSGSGADVAGLKAHMDAQAQLLQRVVLHEKMGKKEPIAEYAGNMLARVDQFTAQPVVKTAPPDDSNVLILEAEMEAPTLAVLRKMQEDGGRWDFTKARQLTLALQARCITAAADREKIDTAEAALRAYAQTAATQLQRFFVRMRIDRTTGLLFAHDETLDGAARSVIAALTALF